MMEGRRRRGGAQSEHPEEKSAAPQTTWSPSRCRSGDGCRRVDLPERLYFSPESGDPEDEASKDEEDDECRGGAVSTSRTKEGAVPSPRAPVITLLARVVPGARRTQEVHIVGSSLVLRPLQFYNPHL